MSDPNGDAQVKLLEPIEAPPTSRLWGDMFGLGGFFKILSDPTLAVQVEAMMRAVIEAAQANKRIEEKLDAVLRERRLAALSGDHRAFGDGAYPASSGTADDGGGGAASGIDGIDER